MADQRISIVARIADATTLTQGLAIDASGRVTIASIATSITPGTGAANLGKAEDGAHASGDVGVMALSVRQNTAAALGGADADYQPLITDTDGRLHVVSATTTVGGATSIPTGSNTIGSLASILTSIVPGTGATNLGKAEDAAHTTGDTGIAIWGVRNDGNTALTGADLDYTPLAVDAAGNLQVDVLSGGGAVSPTNPAWDITNVTTPVNLAAGASGNADSADLPAKYLWDVVISSSVSFKATLGTNDNGTIVNKAVFFGGPGTVTYRVPFGFIQAPAAGVGTQGWRVALVNEDTSETADCYVSYAYADNAG